MRLSHFLLCDRLFSKLFKFSVLQVVPRFNLEGDLERGHVMHVSWAADHRVIDGAEVARFSNLWKSYVENPASMVVDMK